MTKRKQPAVSLARRATQLAPAASAPQKDPIFKNEKGQLAITEAGSIKVSETFLGSSAMKGQENTALDNHRFVQVAQTLPPSGRKWDDPLLLNIALEGVAALAPKDGMEVMLCSQLVALHSQGMEFLRRGMLPAQDPEGVDSNVNRATKTFRTFAAMAECLRTYRGGGQQKMVVEHVTVQSGGQAIVGPVATGGV